MSTTNNKADTVPRWNENPTYPELIDKLPRPYSAEEQYLYSIACTVAGVEYKLPFNNPFWRKEQYLHAIWEVAIQKMNEPTIPTDGTVSESKIVDGAVTTGKINNAAVIEDKLADNAVSTAKIKDLAVITQKIANLAVTTEKLAADAVITEKIAGSAVTAEKLAGSAVLTEKIKDLAVTEAKLSQAVADKLLGDNRITTAMIQNTAVTSSKLADGSITTAKVQSKAVTKEKLSDGVTALLLESGHTGILKQNALAEITQTGEALTLDVIKAKINEIIRALKSAQLTR